jgi:hypothetical protein
MDKAKKEKFAVAVVVRKSSALDLILDLEDQLLVSIAKGIEAFEESDHIAKQVPFCFLSIEVLKTPPALNCRVRRSMKGDVIVVDKQMYIQPRVSLPEPKLGQKVYRYDNISKEISMEWALPILPGYTFPQMVEFYDEKCPQIATWLRDYTSGKLSKYACAINTSSQMIEHIEHLISIGRINIVKENPTISGNLVCVNTH